MRTGQLSAESYIKERGRSLPVVKCRINEDWQETGLLHLRCQAAQYRKYYDWNLSC